MGELTLADSANMDMQTVSYILWARDTAQAVLEHINIEHAKFDIERLNVPD